MFAFILGTGRCGSTLVQEVLARHPDTAFVSNLDDRLGLPPFLGRWNGPLYRRLPVGATQKGRIRFAPSEAYRIMERQVSPVLSEPTRDLTGADATPWLTDQLRAFFLSRSHQQPAPVFLHKFTGWPRAGLLRAVFPEAKFIHIVRDGRAVANSWLQMPWWRGYRGPENWHWGQLPREYAEEWERGDRSFALLAGIAWKLLVDAFDVARSGLPGWQWLDIRYEDVVREPEETFTQMLEFLGLDYSAEFARSLRSYRFAAGRLEAYRRDLDMQSFALLQMSLAGHLARFGYAQPLEPLGGGSARTIHLAGLE